MLKKDVKQLGEKSNRSLPGQVKTEYSFPHYPQTGVWSVEPCKDPEIHSIDYVNSHFRMHTHVHHEFAIVTKGFSNVVTVEDSTMVKAPFLVFYPANIPHMQVNDYENGYNRVLFCCMEESFRNGFLSIEDAKTLTDCNKVTIRRLTDYEQKILTSLCRIISETENTDEYTIRCISCAILSHIAAVLRNNDRGAYVEVQNLKGRHYFGTLLKFIADHCDEKLSLDMLAQQFYISRTKLARDFRNIVGMSVGDYILTVRIGKAKTMLLSGKPMTEVAESCGFNTVSYFIQCYKRMTGVTPAQYVEYIKSNPEAMVQRLYGKDCLTWYHEVSTSAGE